MSKAYERLEQQVGEEKAELMIHYMDEILRMNEHINLTAVRDPEEFIVKHLLDSLGCVGSPEWEKADTIADVGTGAGFPGVPLAVMAPEKKISLIDSLQKRLRVIDDITRSLDIQNTTTFHLRAEEAGQSKEYRETFVAYKGEKAEEEIKEAEKAIRLLGGKIDRIETVNLEDESAENHALVYIKKVKKTPAKFPRKSGTARKEPL